MITIEDLAFDVLESDFIPDAIGTKNLISYAKRLISAWQAQQEPVAYRKLLKFEGGTEEYKYMSFKLMKDAEPLYIAPPPSHGAQK